MKISLIFGTRPEAIKLCPLVLALRQHPGFEVNICVTAQHREMLDQVLGIFNVMPDADLALMKPNQSLASFGSRAVAALDNYIRQVRPDLVIVQGDTTTAFCGALAAFYNRIPVAHVEAGLRTWNKLAPYPEEVNRVMVSHLADYHFAPTQRAKNNLLREGIAEERIYVTGNTVIDALLLAVEKVRRDPPPISGLDPALMNGRRHCPLVLITGHRRENFGPGFEAICGAIRRLAESFPDVEFVYPVHLNPNVREPVLRILGCSGRRDDAGIFRQNEQDGQGQNQPLSHIQNLHLIEPLPYLQFVALMDRAALILTDSGGVQEEAPSLGKPVLVMRDTTERPEAVEAGTVRLVGASESCIIEQATRLLTERRGGHSCPSPSSFAALAPNPYGDGHACDRIVEILEQTLER